MDTYSIINFYFSIARVPDGLVNFWPQISWSGRVKQTEKKTNFVTNKMNQKEELCLNGRKTDNTQMVM